jgi:hypothetical protein
VKATINPNLMKNQLNNGWAGVVSAKTSLQLLVNRLVSNSLAGIVHSKSVVVNEVSSEFFITADENKITPVISELFTTVVTNARNGHIYITAERFKDIIILEIQDRNNYNGYALAYSLKAVESQATMIGGNITIKGQQQLIATISFSFPNQLSWLNYDC